MKKMLKRKPVQPTTSRGEGSVGITALRESQV